MSPAPEYALRTYNGLKADVARETEEIVRLTAELAERTETRDSAVSAIQALEHHYPDLADHTDSGSVSVTVTPATIATTATVPSPAVTGTGRSLVLRLFTELPGEWFLIGEMVQKMIEHGWLTGTVEDNQNKIRIATIRLVEQGLAVREAEKAHGNAYRYRLRLPEDDGSDVWREGLGRLDDGAARATGQAQ